jgi:hypothetical protein
MIVRADLSGVDAPPAGHAEVENQCVAFVGADQPIFGAAAQAGHRRSCQPLAKIGRKGSPEVLSARLDRDEAAPHEYRRKAAHRRLDLRAAQAHPFPAPEPFVSSKVRACREPSSRRLPLGCLDGRISTGSMLLDTNGSWERGLRS